MSDWIEVGQKAPDFTLPDADGKSVRLSKLRGKPIVLYFYPRDFTPGCTRQACGIRDAERDLKRLGAVVLGVSPDTAERHAKFREEYELNFTLLADHDHAVAEKYGAWREKTLYGKKSLGIQRSTFLIDAGGKVVRVWQRVKADQHADDVLAALKGLD